MYVGFTTTGVGLDKNRSFGAVVRQERNTWRVRDSAPPLRRWSSRRVCVILGTVRESELERLIAAIALLHDPVRRGLYRYVRGRRRAVSRDEAGSERALGRVAAHVGRRAGSDARRARSGGGGGRRHIGTVVDVLDAWGYEPSEPGGGIVLGNCPFDALAKACRPLVCKMNLALL